jgi:hypothetical protein
MDPDDIDEAHAYAALEEEMSQPDNMLHGEEPIGDEYRQLARSGDIDLSEIEREYENINRQQYAEQVRHQPAPAQHMPRVRDLEEDPVGHFQDRLTVMEGNAVGHSFLNHVRESEQQARAEIGDDYDRACEHLENGRYAEIERAYPDNPQTAALARSRGYRSPQDMRVAILNQDRMAVAQRALQLGVSPAGLYYEIALQRGYKSDRGLSKSEHKRMLALYEQDPEAFDREWDRAARAGRL